MPSLTPRPVPEVDDRAVLRPWRSSDAPVLRAVSREPELARQLRGAPFDDDAAAAAFIASTYRFDEGARHWAIALPDGSVVGAVAVSAIERRHDTGGGSPTGSLQLPAAAVSRRPR